MSADVTAERKEVFEVVSEFAPAGDQPKALSLIHI